MYRILNNAGRTLCFQRASTSAEAVAFAKMYGHGGAVYAVAA